MKFNSIGGKHCKHFILDNKISDRNCSRGQRWKWNTFAFIYQTKITLYTSLFTI